MGWLDWADLTANDYMSIRFINDVYANMSELTLIGLAQGYTAVPLVGVSTDKQFNTLPIPSFFNTIEQDIVTAGRSYPLKIQFLPAITWRGETNDPRFLNYTDINRWFYNLRLVKQALVNSLEQVIYCGEISCGEDGEL